MAKRECSTTATHRNYGGKAPRQHLDVRRGAVHPPLLIQPFAQCKCHWGLACLVLPARYRHPRGQRRRELDAELGGGPR